MSISIFLCARNLGPDLNAGHSFVQIVVSSFLCSEVCFALFGFPKCGV